MQTVMESDDEAGHGAECESCQRGETQAFPCSGEMQAEIERRAAFYGRTWDEELNYTLAVMYEQRKPDPDDDDMNRRLRYMRTRGFLPSQQRAEADARLATIRRLPNGATVLRPTTVREACEIYLEYGLKGRPSYNNTRRTIRHTIENSGMGEMRLSDLTPGFIKQWHAGMASRHVTGNKGLKTLRTALRLCREFELFDGEDPTKGIQRFREDARKRYVTPREMPRLLYALETSDPKPRAFFLTCLFTASRPGEVSLMRWRDLDFVDMRWRKPTSKTGQAQEIVLPPIVYRLLRELPEVSEFVFPGNDLAVPWDESTYRKAWKRVRAVAQLNDVTAYDLRRTTASWLANHGVNLSTIQCVLNHATLQATHRYARLDVQTAGKALSGVAKHMAASNPFFAKLCAPLTFEDLPLEAQASREAWSLSHNSEQEAPLGEGPADLDRSDMEFPG